MRVVRLLSNESAKIATNTLRDGPIWPAAD